MRYELIRAKDVRIGDQIRERSPFLPDAVKGALIPTIVRNVYEAPTSTRHHVVIDTAAGWTTWKHVEEVVAVKRHEVSQ